jgi:hypothetical protein
MTITREVNGNLITYIASMDGCTGTAFIFDWTANVESESIVCRCAIAELKARLSLKEYRKQTGIHALSI